MKAIYNNLLSLIKSLEKDITLNLDLYQQRKEKTNKQRKIYNMQDIKIILEYTWYNKITRE